MDFAAAALDLHRVGALPGGPLVAPAAELAALHALVCALLRLLDAHAERARPVREVAEPLHQARVRAWQLADLLHRAAHTVPGPSCVGEGLCRRHREAEHLVRRRTSPADLRT